MDSYKLYYDEMLKKGRLIPFIENGKLICLITFLIGNETDKDRFIRDNMWSVEVDNPQGVICFIDQLLTDKTSHKQNHKLSYQVWKRFKDFIKSNFPNVEQIYWHRYKNGKVNIHKSFLNKEK